MADAGDEQGATWPLPKFYFSVDLAGAGQIPFQEVSGLDTEAEAITYRAGDTPAFSAIKMPGLIKPGTVTLKKGISVSDDRFWTWFGQIKENTIKRQPVVISLRDETDTPTMVWKLANAFPVKITGTEMKSDGNEVTIETLELAFDKLTIETV